MARQVDIWWESGGRLKASMRWTNKRGRISFTLIPSDRSHCEKCPFKSNPICRLGNDDLCSVLWTMKGDNQFEGRNKIGGWQPLGPVKRGRKRKEG